MNIFILDKNMGDNVAFHCDKHVVKQILEAAQVGCAAHWLSGGEAPYRLTHKGHPIVQWAANHMCAYQYVVNYGLALCIEFEWRYGHGHKTKQHLLWLKDNEPPIPNTPAKFQIVTAADCIVPGDVVTSYRKYYVRHKSHLFDWKKRPVPSWIDDPIYQEGVGHV